MVASSCCVGTISKKQRGMSRNKKKDELWSLADKELNM